MVKVDKRRERLYGDDVPFIAKQLLVLLLLQGSAQTQTAGPVIVSFTPQTVSPNSIIELRGHRLESNQTKVYFTQNGNTHLARTGGSSSQANDRENGRQILEVFVPEQIVNGPGQLIVEVNGVRSAPVTVTIVDWKLPEVKDLSPKSGAPGTLVFLPARGFHVNDEIELTDAAGKVTSFETGGSSRGTAFNVPDDAAEGPMMIRIGSRKHGHQFTEPVKFMVTNDPLPIDLLPGSISPVAPGQWLDLVGKSAGPMKRSELTEVAFKQSGRTIIVATHNPKRPHVAVPTALSHGEVQIQTRTWRNGRASVWSPEITIVVTGVPMPPVVDGIRLENEPWVDLYPGPDRAKFLNAKAGDVILMNGRFRAVDAAKLKVTLVGPTSHVDLSVTETDPNTERFGEITFKLPDTLASGDWRIVVSNTEDGSQTELTIALRIR